jgi:hypothetical protein
MLQPQADFNVLPFRVPSRQILARMLVSTFALSFSSLALVFVTALAIPIPINTTARVPKFQHRVRFAAIPDQ